MILVPVKNLLNAKQRLSPVLTQAERTTLAEAMLHDVLTALARCRPRTGITLVTSDPVARGLAAKYMFDVIEDPENGGETAAIELATTAAIAMGAKFVMVVPGDIPMISAEEIEQVLDSAPVEGCVLVPASDSRGTNAILKSPPGLFPLRFGNDSFQPHLASAKATGKDVIILELPGIGLDVDGPDDLASLLSLPARTDSQRLLKEWSIPDRLKGLSTNTVHA